MNTMAAQPIDLTVVYALANEDLERYQLPALALRIATFFDGIRTADMVLKKARISEDRGLAVIKKLTSLKVIRPVLKDPNVTSMSRIWPCPSFDSGFTALDEAFFATEVSPIDECDTPFETWSTKTSQAFVGIIARLASKHALP
ncbi:MAG: hypothetical protein V1754_02875 [Pseudomonadota bacterium]